MSTQKCVINNEYITAKKKGCFDSVSYLFLHH